MITFKKPRCSSTSDNGVIYIFDITYTGNPLYASIPIREESISNKDILKRMTEQNNEKIKEMSSCFCEFSSPYFSKNYTSDYFISNVKHVMSNYSNEVDENKHIFLSPHSVNTFIPHSIRIKNKSLIFVWTLNQESITFDIEEIQDCIKNIPNAKTLEEYDTHKINTVCTGEEPISLHSKDKPHKLQELKLRAKLLSIKAQKAIETYEAYKNKKSYHSDTSDDSDDSDKSNNS